MFDNQKIKKLIKRRGMTQDEFARKINLSKMTINNYLTGRTKIDVETLDLISKALDVSPSYFFEENTKVNETPTKYGINDNTVNGTGININIKLQQAEKEIEHLKGIIKQLEERIKDKDELINIYKNKK